MGDIAKVRVWSISMELAENIYRITKKGELSRDFSLRDQIRRAAISIPSNIAEGIGSGYDNVGIKYFNLAKGSASELKTQLILAYRIGFISKNESDLLIEDIDEIGIKLSKLISYRKKNNG